MPPTSRIPGYAAPQLPRRTTQAEQDAAARDATLKAIADTADTADAQAALTLRVAAGRGEPETRAVALHGPEHEWQNDTHRTIGACIEVTKGGDIGAVLTVGEEKLPADMPGARSRWFILDPNARLELDIPTGVKALVHVAEPGVFFHATR